jgi:hypothetical protein
VSSLFFHFSLFLFWFFIFNFSLPNCSHSAKPPLSPPFHPHSLLSDCRSVQVGCTRYSRCCHLVIDLCSPLSKETGPGVSRSHLISAVKLGCLDTLFFSLLLFFASFLCFSFFLPAFPSFHREISSQDRLGTTIVNSIDPQHPFLAGHSSL